MDIYGYLWIFMDIYGYLWIFMDIYGMIYLDPCGPRQRPHFNRAWQRFARKAIHVSRPGDVMR